MEDPSPLHQLEGQEELLAVRPHCLDVETDVLTITLQHLPHIHAVKEK